MTGDVDLLEDLRSAAAQLDEALRWRNTLILQAAERGLSERRIAAAAGLTPPRIKQMKASHRGGIRV